MKKNIYLDEEDKARYIEILAKLAGHTLCGTEDPQRQCSVLHTKEEMKFYIHA